MKKGIRADMREPGSRIRVVYIIGEGEPGIAPIEFLLPFCYEPVSFISDADEMVAVSGKRKAKHDADRIAELNSRMHGLHRECAYHPENGKRGELEEVMLELVKLSAEHGIYHIPVYFEHVDGGALENSLYGRKEAYNFSPERIVPVFDGEPSEESAAKMLVSALLDFRDAEHNIIQAVVYVKDAPISYSDAAEEVAGIFGKYAEFVTEEFARRRDEKEYRHRHDWDPAWF